MTGNGKKPGSSRKAPAQLPAESAFNLLINETALLFHRLRIVADQIHQQGEMSGGLRSILRSLDILGGQTVPQMARSRSVSRQHVQILVNQLVDLGYVETTPNPEHKRSALMRLTPQGKKAVDAMNQHERKLLSKSDLAVSDKELQEAAETLRAVRALFESEQWKKLVKTVK
jgi:DNA-binding MarR family transcriptional regulator